MLSIQEPPDRSTPGLLLTRRFTQHQHGHLKPLILMDHLLERPYAQSPITYLGIGSHVQAKVFFNIEVLRDESDGLPRADVLLSFDELIILPPIDSEIEIYVSIFQSHAITT